MGLDLIVESRAKAGHEAEWRGYIEQLFGAEEFSEAAVARFHEISTPAYANLGAPRVGFDAEADAWIIETREARTPDEIANVLKDFHGHYALALVESDGLPRWSHANLYDGVDETSFRGSFLEDCRSVLPKKLIDRAWEHFRPEDAMDYGRMLLGAADGAKRVGPIVGPSKRGLLARLGLGRRTAEPVSIADQLEIVTAAGRWFIFWGERGHPIRAWG
jgi:hypothetical protein